MSVRPRQSRCERARTWAALAPDGELAALERGLLVAHVAHCVACRSFAEQVAAIAAELRAAAAERPSRRLALPAPRTRRSAYARGRTVASAAAVAAMALGVADRTPFAPADEPSRVSRPATSAAVEEAEQHTLRFLRQEARLSLADYPDRPSRTFGNQPA